MTTPSDKHSPAGARLREGLDPFGGPGRAERLIWNEIEQSFTKIVSSSNNKNNLLENSDIDSSSSARTLYKERRSKRAVEQVIVPKIVRLEGEEDRGPSPSQSYKRVVTMDCDLGTAKCIQIHCRSCTNSIFFRFHFVK